MNNGFSFKLFRVDHDRCAMKVCTDSCILGAIAANYILKASGNQSRVLDIGSGTGLLSLMIAQKNRVEIHAVEYDEAAVVQSRENIKRSPFAESIKVHHIPVQDFKDKPFDFIVTNPPFYEESLASGCEGRNTAMHSLNLTREELISAIKRLLATSGYVYMLLPFSRTGETETMALRKGLHVHERILIRHSPNHSFTRSILILSDHRAPIESETEFCIRVGSDYSDEFRHLLKDYYLML